MLHDKRCNGELLFQIDFKPECKSTFTIHKFSLVTHAYNTCVHKYIYFTGIIIKTSIIIHNYNNKSQGVSNNLWFYVIVPMDYEPRPLGMEAIDQGTVRIGTAHLIKHHSISPGECHL